MSERQEVRQPKCPQCRSRSLTLREEHIGFGVWASDEWRIDENGDIDHNREGWSENSPTGRWEYECEDCGHRWTRRGGLRAKEDGQ